MLIPFTDEGIKELQRLLEEYTEKNPNQKTYEIMFTNCDHTYKVNLDSFRNG